MSDGVSSLLSTEIDIADRAILLLITKKNPSSYAVWAAMNQQMQGKGLAYVNVKKRIRRMVEMGVLQRIEPPAGTRSIRGRKEYMVTMEGMKQLVPHVLAHPEEIPGIIGYMDEFRLDKQAFGASLIQNYAFTTLTLNEYLKYIEIPEVIPLGVKNAMTKIVKRMEQTERKHPKIKKVLIKDTIEVSDSVTSKAAHAIRVTTNNTSKPTTRKKS